MENFKEKAFSYCKNLWPFIPCYGAEDFLPQIT